MYKVVYAGCNFFSSVFESLLSRTDVRVVLCLTGEADAPSAANIVRLAKRHSVPVHCGRLTPALLRRVQGLSPDILLAASYGYRLPVTSLGIRYNLNVHGTLLPHGRGPNPLPHLLTAEGAPYSGLTVHEMTDEFDAGHILEQVPVMATSTMGYNELSLAMYAAAPGLVGRVLDTLEFSFSLRRAQGAGSYWPRPSDAERTIDWSANLMDIADKSRRFGSLGVNCTIDGTEYRVTHPLACTPADHELPAGRVMLYGRNYVYVAARGGLVRVETESLRRGDACVVAAAGLRRVLRSIARAVGSTTTLRSRTTT